MPEFSPKFTPKNKIPFKIIQVRRPIKIGEEGNGIFSSSTVNFTRLVYYESVILATVDFSSIQEEQWIKKPNPAVNFL